MMAEISPGGGKDNLTQAAFDQLLSALDAVDRDLAGVKYIELRDNLRQFFRWRGASHPEDAADETLNRTARKLAAGEQILDLRSYVFGVARFLALEINRLEERNRRTLIEIPAAQAVDDRREKQIFEIRLRCLESCLEELSEADRALILEYYQGERRAKIANRKTLLKKLNLSASGLRMKTLRLRGQLENCLQNCINQAAI